MSKKFIAIIAILFSFTAPVFAEEKSVYDFSFTSIEGEPMPMKQFEGKVVLLVNTASKCGFTPQFEGLQELWTKYQDKGLVVIGVPSGNFKEQELETGKEIKEFCSIRYGVNFPLAEKNNVIGDEAHPLYKWLKAQLGSESRPKWNFHKYLIDSKGNPVTFFPTKTEPMSAEVLEKIDSVLNIS